MAQEWKEVKAKVAGAELNVYSRGQWEAVTCAARRNWTSRLVTLAYRTRALTYGDYSATPRFWKDAPRSMGPGYSRSRRLLCPGDSRTGWSPVDVIGFSIGGWIAAEMAACDAKQFRKMVLVAPTGIRPPQGDISDMFIVTARAYTDASVNSIEKTPEFAKLYGGEQTPEQFEAWEDARAETARIAWQPYMFNPSLPNLLENVVGLPTMIVWGKQDQIVPVSASRLYNESIPGSDLVLLDNCGHRPEIEQTTTFVERVQRFLA